MNSDFRHSLGSRAVRVGRRLVSPLVLLGLWQLGSSTDVIKERDFPAPSTVLSEFKRLWQSGELMDHTQVSVGRVLTGLAIGITVGTVLAVLAGISRIGEDIIDAPMQMLRTLPVLALIPFFILWFGIGEQAKILMVAMGVSFPIYLNTFAGIRGVDNRLVEAAQTVGLRRLGLIRHVVLPGALPSFLVGLRYALGTAWLVLVVSELNNASEGLGYMMTQAREFMRTGVLVVGLVMYACLGLMSDTIVRVLERFALAWRPTFSGAGPVRTAKHRARRPTPVSELAPGFVLARPTAAEAD